MYVFTAKTSHYKLPQRGSGRATLFYMQLVGLETLLYQVWAKMGTTKKGKSRTFV